MGVNTAIYGVLRYHTGVILTNLKFFEDLSWSEMEEVLEEEVAEFLNEREHAKKVKTTKKVKNV